MFATSASRQANWIPDSWSTATAWTALSTRGLLLISNLTLMSWWITQCINTVRAPAVAWWLLRRQKRWPVDPWWDLHMLSFMLKCRKVLFAYYAAVYKTMLIFFKSELWISWFFITVRLTTSRSFLPSKSSSEWLKAFLQYLRGSGIRQTLRCLQLRRLQGLLQTNRPERTDLRLSRKPELYHRQTTKKQVKMLKKHLIFVIELLSELIWHVSLACKPICNE